jgi:hypothetical protein
MFVSGYLGWDENSRLEFRDAVELVPAPFDRVARFAVSMLLIGASFSPLENRFPAKPGAEAALEAKVLSASEADLR